MEAIIIMGLGAVAIGDVLFVSGLCLLLSCLTIKTFRFAVKKYKIRRILRAFKQANPNMTVRYNGKELR